MKIFFDNTFGKPMVVSLRDILSQYHEEPIPIIKHKQELFSNDTPDDKWVPQLVEDDWIVISNDKGNEKPRLHEICRQNNKTLVILSPSIGETNTFYRLAAIMSAWPQLVELSKQNPGTRWRMKYTSSKKHHVTLEEKPYLEQGKTKQ